MIAHSRRAKLMYAIAAVPAAFLPFSYVVGVISVVFWIIIPEHMGGSGASESKPTGIVDFIIFAGLWGTVIQWPVYLLWAALSREMTIRVRLLWMGVIVLLNMFGMPWFLYCKYQGTTRTALAPRFQPEYMNHPRKLKIIIVVLIVGIFALLGFLGHLLAQNMMWKSEVESLAEYEGATRASHDFQSGKLRLFVISGERDGTKYSGTNAGPFEIWFPQYFPKYYPLRYQTEQMVAAYNDRMRYLQAHPETALAETNGIKLHSSVY
ncbi:MAG TPA: hypothetical protein VKU37_07925 [Verrucomicrobiae bacterium]|nr:hypothetical protein [Verrucomicrobiae bacterium]